MQAPARGSSPDSSSHPTPKPSEFPKLDVIQEILHNVKINRYEWLVLLFPLLLSEKHSERWSFSTPLNLCGGGARWEPAQGKGRRKKADRGMNYGEGHWSSAGQGCMLFVCAASKRISVCVLKEKFTSFQDKALQIIHSSHHPWLSFFCCKEMVFFEENVSPLWWTSIVPASTV